jgi:hypothetical protein
VSHSPPKGKSTTPVHKAWAFEVFIAGCRDAYAEFRLELTRVANTARIVRPVTDAPSSLLEWYENGEDDVRTLSVSQTGTRTVYVCENAKPTKWSIAWDKASNKGLCEHLTVEFQKFAKMG